MLFGKGEGRGDHEILCKDSGGRGRHIARKNRKVEGAGFLQAASGRGEAESARQRGFRKCMLQQRKIRVTSAPLPEATSDPAQPRRRRIAVSLLDLHSWLGSCFGGFFVETSFQIPDGVTNTFGRCAAGNFFRGERRFHAEALREIGFKRRRDFFKNFERQRRPRNILFLGFTQNFPNKIVGLAERNSFVNEIVGTIRGKEHTGRSSAPNELGVEFCSDYR